MIKFSHNILINEWNTSVRNEIIQLHESKGEKVIYNNVPKLFHDLSRLYCWNIYQAMHREWGCSSLNQSSRVRALGMEKFLLGSASPPNGALRGANPD